MNKIEFGEGCFGPYVRVDGESLFEHEYSNEEDIKRISSARENLLNELVKLSDKLDMNDWRSIAEIVVSRGGWLWEEDERYSDSCDQCGNYNWGEVYTK